MLMTIYVVLYSPDPFRPELHNTTCERSNINGYQLTLHKCYDEFYTGSSLTIKNFKPVCINYTIYPNENLDNNLKDFNGVIKFPVEHPVFCNNIPFNLYDVNIKAYKFWHSCYGINELLWKNDWLKYGSCCSSLSQKNYFNLGLVAFDTIPTNIKELCLLNKGCEILYDLNMNVIGPRL